MARARAQGQQVMVGVARQPMLRPAFTVKKLEGTRAHVVHVFDKKANKIKKKVIHEPAGFLVTFYKGHSIRCKDEEALHRVGAGVQLVPLVNEDGEVKGTMPNAFAVDIDLPTEEDDALEEATND